MISELVVLARLASSDARLVRAGPTWLVGHPDRRRDTAEVHTKAIVVLFNRGMFRGWRTWQETAWL
jgi:hypothetical protein